MYLQQSLLAMVERLGGYEDLTLLQLYYSIDEVHYILDQLITLLSHVSCIAMSIALHSVPLWLTYDLKIGGQFDT